MKKMLSFQSAHVIYILKAIIYLLPGTWGWVQSLWNFHIKYEFPPWPWKGKWPPCEYGDLSYGNETTLENAVKSWRGPTYHSKAPLLELKQRQWNNNDLSVGPVQGGGFTCSLADRCCNALQVCLPLPFISNSWLRLLLKWDSSPFFVFWRYIFYMLLPTPSLRLC